jgi:hypothetical protein
MGSVGTVGVIAGIFDDEDSTGIVEVNFELCSPSSRKCYVDVGWYLSVCLVERSGFGCGCGASSGGPSASQSLSIWGWGQEIIIVCCSVRHG